MHANDSWSVEEVTRIGDLEGLREEWAALCDRSPRATPFQRPEWLIPWWRAFPPGEPWVLVVRREGRLAGLAPLLLYSGDGGRTVGFCGGGVSDYCDLVAGPDGEEATRALLTFLVERRERWDVCDLEPLPEGSPLLRADPPEGFAAVVEPRDVCLGLDLPERVEDLGAVVRTRQLSNLRKYRRHAETLGELRLEAAGEESWEESLEVLIRFHLARREETGQPGMLGGEALRAFHREVAAGFLGRGALGLYVLRLDGEPLAALYGFREKGTFCAYMQGFDSAVAKLSPGVMVTGGAVEDAIRRGCRRFDFLRGREAYKTWWGARERPTFRWRFRPSRPSGQ
ncbi:MAG: hypothetical protein QOF89_816 [Acidobacteriota bacterium]|jgi:CelD/BcsL family acetyltransferase involved in cellulose biosynthesis|nr:hypothetical protein [Acidobacteriota bacterium]